MHGVYFPGQHMRFKMNEPSKQFVSMRDGYYGIVSKKPKDLTLSSDDDTKFADHYSVGVYVRITDQ